MPIMPIFNFPVDRTFARHGAEIRDWWLGDLPLVRTTLIGAALYCFVLCLWTALFGAWGDDLYLHEWLHRRSPWLVLNTLLMLSWALPVLRCCLNRLRLGYSVWVTFTVFMTTGYFLVSGVASQFSEAVDVVRILRADDSGSWTPLDVYADPALGRIVATGDITPHSAELFERVVRANPQYPVVELESLGGLVRDAERIAALVQDRGLSTVSMQVCASACTLIFVAGKQRFLGPNARFGFHRSGYPGMPLNTPPSLEDQRHAQTLRGAGVAEDFIRRELATPHQSIWKPSHAEMFAANFATLWWSERPTGW